MTHQLTYRSGAWQRVGGGYRHGAPPELFNMVHGPNAHSSNVEGPGLGPAQGPMEARRFVRIKKELSGVDGCGMV